MSISTRLIGSYLKLPRPVTRKIAAEKDIGVPMPDGTVLLADRYYPRDGENSPLVLVRSFYGRKGFFGVVWGRLLAEQGFQVFIQSCRGTFGSGGDLLPLVTEKDDGLATVEWLKQQDWFPGEFATTGPSYLGFVQWAIARDAGPELKAMAPQITASNFHGMGFPGDSFALNTSLSWTYLINRQESDIGAFIALLTVLHRLKRVFNHLPLSDLDKLSLGKQVDFWQLLLVMGEPNDGDFTVADFSSSVPEVTAPVSMQGGWYDIFLPWMIKDFEMLQEAGRKPYMMVGPWNHINAEGGAAGLKDSVAWLRAHMLGDRSGLREAPVRLFVMGAGEWRDYETWPPEESSPERWHLQQAGGLGTASPVESAPDRYRYDPSDPTPSMGGAVLFEKKSVVDNRALEERPDVLVYTGDVLEDDLEIIGPVRAELYIRSGLEHTDFFARLCDVYPSGKSMNVCDGLQRIRPGHPEPDPDGCIRVEIDLWPTAYRFRRGHRIRLQVSSGAHPRFARNTGSGEPLASAVTLCPAIQEVYHDPEHPSAVILPVMQKGEGEKREPAEGLNMCAWCNSGEGRMEEISVPVPSGGVFEPRVEKAAVHPEHAEQVSRFLAGAAKHGKLLLAGLILNLVLSSLGVLLLPATGAGEFWTGVVLGPVIAVIAVLLMVFPYAVVVPVRSNGIRKTILMTRMLALSMLILGIWFVARGTVFAAVI